TRLRWHANVRADQINPSNLRLMKKAGCFGVAIGIESGSDKTLKEINKKTTVEMNKRACAYVKEAGLSLCVSFVLGFPTETESDMRETINFMKILDCNSKGLGIFRPLPGSYFYNEFISKGVLLKEDIDWSDLGNFSIISKYSFCDVPRARFEKIVSEALEVMYGSRWTAIHKDVLLGYPKLIKEIASKTKIKIARSENYDSSTHVSYIPLSFTSLYNNLVLVLRNLLPLKIRVEGRRIVSVIRRIKKNFRYEIYR
ncbi:MAG: radical SAM protein, partial [Candidatus Pacebacteria bacterium]|nr:radical SAM protein [Candidatus Paceibacterota bacterium]